MARLVGKFALIPSTAILFGNAMPAENIVSAFIVDS